VLSFINKIRFYIYKINFYIYCDILII
jgi:hypothetical protein